MGRSGVMNSSFTKRESLVVDKKNLVTVQPLQGSKARKAATVWQQWFIYRGCYGIWYGISVLVGGRWEKWHDP